MFERFACVCDAAVVCGVLFNDPKLLRRKPARGAKTVSMGQGGMYTNSSSVPQIIIEALKAVAGLMAVVTITITLTRTLARAANRHPGTEAAPEIQVEIVVKILIRALIFIRKDHVRFLPPAPPRPPAPRQRANPTTTNTTTTTTKTTTTTAAAATNATSVPPE